MSDYLPPEVWREYQLPPEVWREIFTRLPVKSILRMRLVCKEFKLLISDPEFIAAHIKKSGNYQKIILTYFSDKERHKKHKFLILNDEGKNLELLNSEEIKFPFEVSLNVPRFWIVGSFHGLVCLCKDYSTEDQIVLWNPSIRKCFYLPTSPKENKDDSNFYFVLGFGFDPKTNDYKVVKLTYLKNNSGVLPSVELFTLSSQSWRILMNNVHNPKRDFLAQTSYGFGGSSFVIEENIWAQIYLNGAVHWIGYKQLDGIPSEKLIIWFNMSDESFGNIKFPDTLANERTSPIFLSVLKNKLSVMQFEKTPRQEWCYIWIMEEYDQVKSWTKYYKIDLQRQIIGQLIGFRKNGEVIIATKGQLKTYNTETLRKRNISGIHGVVDSFFLVSYIESLILLDQEGAESVS